MDLGTPEPQSESEEGEIEKTGGPRGPRTPPPDHSKEEKQPYTPEGSPPLTSKSHRGPRTPSPACHSSSRLRSHRKQRRRRSRSSKVKGPRTPSPVDRTPVRSSHSSKGLLSPSKTSHSPSPHILGQGNNASVSTAKVTSHKPSASPKTVQEDIAVTAEESVPTTADSVESQVAKSGSNSPTLKSDTPKLHSPLPVLPHTPPQPNPPLFSSSQEHSPLNLSFDSEVERTETQQKWSSPPKKKHRGEGRSKVKRKTSKAKEEYRHKVSQVKCTCNFR